MISLKDFSLIVLIVSIINFVYLFILSTDFIFRTITIVANGLILGLSIVLFRRDEIEGHYGQ